MFKLGNKINTGKHLSEKTKQKISTSNKGKKRSKEFSERMSKLLKGKTCNDALKKWRENGGVSWNKGLRGVCVAWNKGLKGYRAGEKSHLWKGGISFEPYGLEFNNDLKEVIRNRDRRKCQLCEKTELDNGVKLSVHHINYDKHDNDPKNLISLCFDCHPKTNFNRENWTNYFHAERLNEVTAKADAIV